MLKRASQRLSQRNRGRHEALSRQPVSSLAAFTLARCMPLSLALAHSFCNALGDLLFFCDANLVEIHALGHQSLENLVD